MVNVVEIVSHHLGVRQIRASADLGQAGEAGLDIVAAMKLRPVLLHQVGFVGPWSHQPHVAPEDVEELRQLIQARPPHDPAQRCHPLVGPDRVEDEGREIVDALGRRPDLLGVVRHCPEFHHGERSTAEAYPLLLEKSGAGRAQLYEQAEEGDERAENGYSQGGGNAIEEF